MGWMTGIQFPAGAVMGLFFSSPPRPPRIWGPPILLPSGYGGLFLLELKRPGREVDHSPPSSAKVKNAWICTSAPSIRLWLSKGYVFVAHKDISAFTWIPYWFEFVIFFAFAFIYWLKVWQHCLTIRQRFKLQVCLLSKFCLLCSFPGEVSYCIVKAERMRIASGSDLNCGFLNDFICANPTTVTHSYKCSSHMVIVLRLAHHFTTASLYWCEAKSV